MKTTLYEIENDLLEIFDQIEEAEGEITEELSNKLEIAEGQLQSKSIAYLSIIRSSEAFTVTIDEEIKRLQGLKKNKVKLVDSLKSRLLNAVNLFGDEKNGLQVGLHTFKKRKSISVAIEAGAELPNEYTITKTTHSPDKKALKEALNSGSEIKGASLSTNYSLSIK